MTRIQTARFAIGQIVRHRDDAFRGVVMDVDHAYEGPAGESGLVRPDQPFYRVFALGEDGGFVAYAAEGALEDGDSVLLPDDAERWFTTDGGPPRSAGRTSALTVGSRGGSGLG